LKGFVRSEIQAFAILFFAVFSNLDEKQKEKKENQYIPKVSRPKKDFSSEFRPP